MRQLPHDSDTFTTISGRQVRVVDPHPEDVVLADLANALSHVCRFGGHVNRHLSVAQHSVLVSEIVEDLGGDPATQFHGLLHDASEAYVGDVISPLKQHLPEYRRIEEAWQLAIGLAFGLGTDLVVGDPLVKEADVCAFHTEWRDNFPDRPPCVDAKPSWRLAIPQPPSRALSWFYRRYEVLAKQLGGRSLAMLD